MLGVLQFNLRLRKFSFNLLKLFIDCFAYLMILYKRRFILKVNSTIGALFQLKSVLSFSDDFY